MLRALFGKDIPDAPTGESLELSALPGLESRDPEGTPLSELLQARGPALAGPDAAGEFPLLLKLLDAREDLSVQVHPNSAYAGEKYGKQGKEEAWVILDAKPGARLVLGFREGITRQDVEDALNDGRGLGGMLRLVPVRAGEAYLIPAGTVHAILGGIVLYEIQQSSDLTFRLHDWGRKDADGKPRELHLRESLDVMDVDSRPTAAVPVPVVSSEKGREELLVSSPHFSVSRLSDCKAFPLPPDPRRFRVLTLLTEGTLESGGRRMQFPKGQTVLLPADGMPASLTCGLALLGRPGRP